MYSVQGKLILEDFEPQHKRKHITKIYGDAKIHGNGTWEFGEGLSGKDKNAGKIGYSWLSDNGLDIVGAGNPRELKNVNIYDKLNVKGYLKFTNPNGKISGHTNTGLDVNNKIYLRNGGLNVNKHYRLPNGEINGDNITSYGNIDAKQGIYINTDMNIGNKLCLGQHCVDSEFLINPGPPGVQGPIGPPGPQGAGIGSEVKLNSLCIGNKCLTEENLKKILIFFILFNYIYIFIKIK